MLNWLVCLLMSKDFSIFKSRKEGITIVIVFILLPRDALRILNLLHVNKDVFYYKHLTYSFVFWEEYVLEVVR